MDAFETYNLSAAVKALRKQYGMTQEELSFKSGVGLRFVRDLEQGKKTLRLDKVNQLLRLFNYEMVATHRVRREQPLEEENF
jgi:y4mF family transcriptional regulator